jgi:hypothetical protein
MDRIQRVSLFFKCLFQVLLVAWPVLWVASWTAFLKMSSTMPASISTVPIAHVSWSMGAILNFSDLYVNEILHPLSFMEKTFGLMISAIPTVVVLYILYSLIKLFSLYSEGEIFSIANVKHIRNIGYAMLMTQIANPICQALMGFALTWHNPPGHRFASISFDQTNVGILFTGLIVILISWIMAEACRLREEQQLTI